MKGLLSLFTVIFISIYGVAKADDVIPVKDAVGCKGLRDSNKTSMPDGSLNEAFAKGLIDSGDCFRIGGAKFVDLQHPRLGSVRLLVYVPGETKPIRLWVRDELVNHAVNLAEEDMSDCVNDCRDE